MTLDKNVLGTVSVTGDRKQLAEAALALHQAGKEVTIISNTGDENTLTDYYDYSVAHRDTFSIIQEDKKGVVQAKFDGKKALKISGDGIEF